MKNKKKISILNITLSSGGAEKVISLLLKELVKDYDVTLILLYKAVHFPIPDEVRTVFLDDRSPRKLNPLQKLFELIRFTRKYISYLKNNNISYAISFLAFPNFINSIATIFNPKAKYIISERGFPSDNTTNKFSKWISKIFYPLLYNRCDKLFSNSIYINNDLRDNFGINIPMCVIYNPIEIPVIKKSAVDNDISTKSLGLINVGTLNERKNQQLIINSINKLNFTTHLTILGSGHLQNDLVSLVDRLNLNEKVVFEGAVKNVEKYLLESDIFVLTSNTEGFPNALLEAMSIGLPCISTNCLSGPLELLHDGSPIVIEPGKFFEGKYGLLINNNDAEGLVNALEFLFGSPEMRRHYHQMSLLKSKQYELKTIYAEFKDFIEG